MKKRVLMALVLGTAVLTAGCSGKTEDKKDTAEVATEAETKTESADETENESETEGDAEDITEGASEAAAAETEEELGERPDYAALDYVTLGTYKGLSVVLDPITVTEEEIDLVLEDELVEQQREGTVQQGDLVNIDYEGKMDGEAFAGGTAQGQDLEIGSRSFIDGFEDGLIGVDVGETVDLNLTFPEEYYEELAGKDVVFTVTVNYITKGMEATDASIEKITDGVYTTLESYREKIRQDLFADKEQAREDSVYNELMTQLYNTCTVNDYPQDVVDYSLASRMQYYRNQAEMAEMELDEFLDSYFGINEEEIIAELEEEIKQGMVAEMILKAIVEKEDLTLSEEEYQAGCDRYLEIYSYRYGFETVEQLEEALGKEMLEEYILYDKALDLVKDNAVIEEPETETETEEIREADAAVTETAESESEEIAEAVAEPESEEIAEAAAEPESEAAEEPESETATE